MKHVLFTLAFACLFIAVAGCGKGHVKMSGRVTYSDTGEPLELGTVSFTNGTIQARGVLDKDGKYVIGMLSAGDGLPPGTYNVYVANAYRREAFQGAPPADETSASIGPPITARMVDGVVTIVEPQRASGGSRQRGSIPEHVRQQGFSVPLINPKFMDPATSGLTLTVNSKTKTFDFTVDRAK